MRPRLCLTVFGFLVLALSLQSSRALGDHHIPTGAALNVRTLQTLDTDSAWPGMRVEAMVDDPIDVGGRIVLPRGAPARLAVVDVRRSSNLEGRAFITLRVVWIEARSRVSSVATNDLQFIGSSDGAGIGETHLRIPAETRMQFQLNMCARVE